MTYLNVRAVGLLVCTLLLFRVANAQTSSTSGLFIEGRLNGSSWTISDVSDESEAGGGLSLSAGYGFSELISGFIDLTGARISPDQGADYALAHVDVGARFTLSTAGNSLRPYLEAAVSGIAAEGDDSSIGKVEMSGTGLTAGGGVLYFVSPGLAVNGGLKATFGELSEVTLLGQTYESELDATSVRLNVGVTWFPQR